ncbi:mRNA-decapping enzyme subunit 2 [Mortierella polycephala]|uniref:mRNA-decapping enzyme subunit 2 n=1 Tax=Mortierella polycephala TaxID=41804 RepID=A0A9P6TW53_9FUNG|nr:mRNA-decapping enzyme subunit 2 [Mortierella polycephala]
MAWTNATFDDVLNDLSSRFIINVPDEELASVERICFQIEQAHWFYEDFVREQNPNLPSFNLKNFSAKFFQHCPLLHEWSNEHETAFANFMEYKIRVPVCGAIILNEAMDRCILVKGWTARSGWGFPKGKINKDEPDTLCAVREVWEETGFDVADRIRDEDYVEQTIKDQRIRLYIIKGVPENTVFEPQTRKEISKIEWHYIAELPASKPKPIEKGTQSGKESGTERNNGAKNPSRFYMVTPFVHKLKGWITAQRRNTKRNKGQHAQQQQRHTHSTENNAAPGPQHHQQQQQQHPAAPAVSATEARLDSEVLKNMLGIGKLSISSEEAASAPQYNHTPQSQSSPPLKDAKDNSESLKALLSIQGNGGSILSRDGIVAGSPQLQSSTATTAFSGRSISTPSPLPSSPYQNGSDALKAMLGISTQSNSPLLHSSHIANGASPMTPHAIPTYGQGPQRPDFSPQIQHSSASSSPMRSRNGSVDLLALLKGGGAAGGAAGGGGQANDAGFGNSGGNHYRSAGNRRSHAGNRNAEGGPVKTKAMQNFTFDVDALF